MDIEFDPEFASTAEYARVYRKVGLQVVPSLSPRESSKAWKRPALNNWREYQSELVDDATFDTWYGPQGLHVQRQNIGILTGKCSGRVFVVDCDDHKGPEAGLWWGEMLDRQQRAGEIEETVTQITGGGGRQIFFRAPEGWTPPTSKSPVYNVDIRGQGGFVVCAPSLHSSGRNYDWVEGLAPWETEIVEAPRWFCEQLDELFGHAGVNPVTGEATGPRVKTPTPDAPLAPFGGILDGREDKMSRMVWARVLDMYRDSPIGPPGDAEVVAEIDSLFHDYVGAVATRLPHRPGATKEQLLDEEGRGYTLMVEKFRAALRLWDTKVAREAALLPPKSARDDPAAFSAALRAPVAPSDETPEPEPVDVISANPALAPISDPYIAASDKVYEVLSLTNLMELPDPRFLIDGVMIENGLSFMFGAPGCGKSFIALSLSMALAAGLKQWWGRDIEHSGEVIYLACEGIADMKYRAEAWCLKMGLRMEDIPLRIIRASINFTAISDINKLAQTVYDCQVKGSKPVLIVVDTVSRTLPGADENLQKDMTIFINSCKFLQDTFGAAVMGVHHEGRATGQMRGSTTLPGAADQIYHIKREKGSMEGLFIADKIKADADGWEWTFVLHDVPLPMRGIKPRKSLFAERVVETPLQQNDNFGGQQETGYQMVAGKRWPPMDKCREIVGAIGRAWSDKDPWSLSTSSKGRGRYAPERIHQQFGVSVETAEHMVHTWLVQDVLMDGEVVDTKTKKRGLKVKNGLA